MPSTTPLLCETGASSCSEGVWARGPQGEHLLNFKLLCRERCVLGIAPALGLIFI